MSTGLAQCTYVAMYIYAGQVAATASIYVVMT